MMLLGAGGCVLAHGDGSDGDAVTGAASGPPVGADVRPLPTDAVLYPRIDEREVKRLQAVHRARENTIVECMSSSGFDYHPAEFLLEQHGGGNPIDEHAPLDVQLEWVHVHGYGLTAEVVGSDTMLVDAIDAVLDPASSMAANLAMLGQMSEPERDAYYAALDGCQDEAYATELEDGAADANEPNDGEQLALKEIEALARQIVRDPAWNAAEELWEPCMRDLGYDFVERIDAPESVKERLDMLADEYDAGELDDPGAAVERLFVDEIALATADLTCLWHVRAARYEIERRYVDEHLAP